MPSVNSVFKCFEKICLCILILSGIFSLVGSPAVFGYYVQEFEETPELADFVLGPAKNEIWLNPGETKTQELYITNRLGKKMGFKVEVEDFTGSQNPQLPVVLLGQEQGPYSLRDYLKPEINEFVLNHGQQMVLPIKISIPEDAEPGGLYGAVLVATHPQALETEKETEAVEGGIRPRSQIASLFFIRVKGEVQEQGFLKDFKFSIPQKSFFQKGPISFELFFKNEGTIHLLPYGIIEIFNIFGKKVAELEVDPYFSLPDSLRAREIKWDKKWGFGKYLALASINRGFGDIIDQKSLVFWIVPWKIILAVMLGGGVVIWFLSKVAKRLKIKIKPKRS